MKEGPLRRGPVSPIPASQKSPAYCRPFAVAAIVPANPDPSPGSHARRC